MPLFLLLLKVLNSYIFCVYFQASTCSFTLPEKLSFKKGSDEKSLDLSNPTQNFLLLANGKWEGDDMRYHGSSGRVPSSDPVNLKSTGSVGVQKQGWLIQAHAICMILAWMASAASGMLMAR